MVPSWIVAQDLPLRQLLGSVGEPLASLALESCLLPAVRLRDQLRQVGERARASIVARHGGRCAICRTAAPFFDLHHIFHHSHGGRTDKDNLIPLCETCHHFAHLGVWTTQFLQAVVDRHQINHALSANSPRNEDELRAEFQETVYSSLAWYERVRRLLMLWQQISQCWQSTGQRQLELIARVQWDLSAILTTHGPAGQSLTLRNKPITLNRLIGIGLAERALHISTLLESDRPQIGLGLRAGIAHCLCVHYRSVGYHDMALKKFRHWCRELQQPDDASSIVTNVGWRAYLLGAHGLDLVRQHAFRSDLPIVKRGIQILDQCVKWVRDEGSRHSYADTVLRQAESRIYAGCEDQGLALLEKNSDLIRADASDVPIIDVIHHKLLMLGLARGGATEAAEREFATAMAAAKKHSLSDQERKLQALYDKHVRKT